MHGRRSSDGQQSQPSSSRLAQSEGTSYAGVLKSLHLQNFMCHGNFTHQFHPNVNFITGQNGSGKSALLSGILIALGGKATVTSRTSSIKSLIQKGKTTARVAVTLLNRNGLQKYGDEITIERWFNGNGGGYKIKSPGADWGDNWRQLKKQELDSITLGLNIQVDNPVAILNQEVARTFLRGKDPKVKFNLFYEGTLLKKIDGLSEDTQTQLDATEAILSTQRDIIDTIRTEIVQLKAKTQKISELNRIKDKLGNLHHEYLWSMVVEQEKACEGQEKILAKTDTEIEVLTNALDRTVAQLENLNEETLSNEQSEVKEKLQETKRRAEANRTALGQLKHSTLQLRMKIKTAASTALSKESQITKLEAQIERVKAEQDAKDKEESSRDQEKLQELEDQRKSLESVVTSIKGDADNFQLSADREREKFDELEANARGLRSNIEKKKRGITVLGRSTNKYAVFGPKMENLISKIQTNVHKFRKQPKGPLGACFSVKDPAYAVLVEGILWNNLDSFVVDNASDLKLLRGYIDSIYREAGPSQRSGRPSGPGGGKKPGIVMVKFAEQMHDISRNLASHHSASTLFELLDVENDDHIIMNALIDICEVEKILLFPTNAAASQVLKHQSLCPRSLKCAYTLNWFKFTPAPQFAARVMKQKSRAEFVRSGQSRESEKESLMLEIRELEVEMKNLEPRRAIIREQEKSYRLTYNEKVTEISNIRRQMGELSNEIKRQRNKISQRDKRCDLSSYYEELEELKEEFNNQTAIRDNATKEFETVKPDILELEAKRKKLDRQLEDLNTKFSGFQEEREKLKTKQQEANNVIKKFQAKITSLEASKRTETKELEAKRKVLEEKSKSALQATNQRVETDKAPGELRKKFSSLKERIKDTEAQLGDVDQILLRLAECRIKYKRYVNDYIPLSKMLKMLTNMHNSQKAIFERTKIQMGRTLTIFFSAMAQQRGYEGRLLVEFTTKELYYFVCPDGQSCKKTLQAIDAHQSQPSKITASQLKQDKTMKKALVEYSLGLSGGERSFATICFVMALWQVMECPFYMLDEFDVFMDAFNRKTSQMALMTHAKKSSMNQFVFFSPLDIGEVPSAEDACVLRLFPPVRGNVTGENPGPNGSKAGSGSKTRSDGGGKATGVRNSDSPVENIDPMKESNVPSKRLRGGTNRDQNVRKRRKVGPASVMSVLQ